MGQAGDILSHNHTLISLDAVVAEHPGPSGHPVAVNDCSQGGLLQLSGQPSPLGLFSLTSGYVKSDSSFVKPIACDCVGLAKWILYC
jgi:hypothetical protein